MKVKALAPWYGSNRMLAEHVGAALVGCEWVGVPFAGGMSELVAIDARTVVVSDWHAHVINLAAVVSDPDLNPKLRERLRDLPFHEGVLESAQERCAKREYRPWFEAWRGEGPDLDWAVDYFVCAWMSRNATAGTGKEFEAPLSLRWEAGGGDSAVRFRNAAEGLAEWLEIMRRCTFARLDVFEFLDKVKDRPKHGLYLDPPFPGPGDKYKHTFGESVHRRLADRLAKFQACRVVCRFYEHPLVRELYPETQWKWRRLVGRTQSNGDAAEVLLVKGATA